MCSCAGLNSLPSCVDVNMHVHVHVSVHVHMSVPVDVQAGDLQSYPQHDLKII